LPQFAVYRNESPRTKAAFPLLVDVQSDLLEDLHTRVVIPLTKLPALAKKPMANLMPVLTFETAFW
jgi:toxin CcdB